MIKKEEIKQFINTVCIPLFPEYKSIVLNKNGEISLSAFPTWNIFRNLIKNKNLKSIKTNWFLFILQHVSKRYNELTRGNDSLFKETNIILLNKFYEDSNCISEITNLLANDIQDISKLNLIKFQKNIKIEFLSKWDLFIETYRVEKEFLKIQGKTILINFYNKNKQFLLLLVISSLLTILTIHNFKLKKEINCLKQINKVTIK